MGEFEKNIQDIFESAEFQPSDRVWSGIESTLKGEKKKGLVIWWQQYGIAAAVVLVLTFGYLFSDQIFNTTEPKVENKELTQNDSSDETEADEDGKKADADETNDSTNPLENEDSGNSIEDEIKKKTIVPNKLQALSSPSGIDKKMKEVISEVDVIGENQVPVLTRMGLSRSLDIALLQLRERRAASDVLKWENENLVLAPSFDWKTQIPRKEQSNRFLLQGLMAGGSFDPNYGESVSALGVVDSDAEINAGIQSLQTAVTNSEDQPESSFSFGGGLGLPLGKRFLLKTGLQFSQYKFSNRSNAYSEENGKRLPINLQAEFSTNMIFFAGDYELKNTLTSVQIPLGISYTVLDFNRLKLGVNAGLGLDYLVSYVISSDLIFLDKRKLDLSSEERFKRLNMNGLLGLEVNYMMNDKFGLGAEMFLRKYLNNEERLNSTGTPAFYGFGLSLNYFLKRK